jgi:hypothetical protein
MKKNLLLTASIIIGVLCFYLFSKNKYEDEKDFAYFGLIREGAIYTLLGDRPVSDFGTYVYPNQDSESNSILIEQEPEKLDISKLTCSEKDHFKKDPYKLWLQWKRRKKLTGSNISLVCVRQEGIDCLYLVNKTLVRQVLLKHYDLLVACIQTDFNVDKVLSKIEDPRSLFWMRLMNVEYGHIGMGLLFGYGLENTIGYHNYRLQHENGMGGYLYDESMEEYYNRMYTISVSLEHLPLPRYCIFQNPDPVLEHYKKERARIQEEYKDADLRQLLIDALEK